MQTVPFLDLKRQFAPLKAPILEQFTDILDTCHFAGGPHVQRFEEHFANYCGVQHAIGVNSGTAALELALRALEIGQGDEVILPAMTFIATATAVLHVGATPVFADIEPEAFTLCPQSAASKITPRTRAIIPVHLYGQPASMEPLMQLAATNSLAVLEDAAQAHGAEYQGQRCGSIGDIAAFSFYPGKNLGAAGEGGAITTNRNDLADRVRMLRDWGQDRKYHHALLGTNARMDAFQGAVLDLRLGHLDEWTRQRQSIAMSLAQALSDNPLLIAPKSHNDRTHVFHVYAAQTDHRDAFTAHLNSRNIASALHYPIPLHLQPCLAFLGYRQGQFPNSEKLARREVSLPLFPGMTEDEINAVVCGIRSFKHNETDA